MSPFRSGCVRHLVVRLALLSALACVIVISVIGWRAYQAALATRDQAMSLRESLRAAPPAPAAASDGQPESELFLPGAPNAAHASVYTTMRETCAQVGELDRALAPVGELISVSAPLGEVLGRVPQVGRQAEGLLALAYAGRELTSGLQLTCAATEGLLSQASSTHGGEGAGGALAELMNRRAKFRSASVHLRDAQTRLASIDAAALDDSSRRLLSEMRERIPMVAPRLALLAELPGLLGYDGPRRYLVLGQNSDELRPTGGFIGTSGVVTLKDGRVIQQRYGSSFDLNVPFDRRVTPPAPLTRFMDAGYWHLREANWSPDFPSAAQQAQYFFRLHDDEPLAGVIALDQDLVAELLTVVGPIAVPGYDEVVTAENVRDRLDYQVHVVSGDTEARRKGFVSALFPLVIERLAALPPERLGDLIVAMNRALAGQDLLIWVDDPFADQALADLGWDGHLVSTSGDYFFLVQANLGANKINREVEQALDYGISVDAEGRLIANASVTLRNRRPTADPGPYRTADYRNYLRALTPLGSELLAADGFDSPPEALTECGRSAFAGMVIVPPGEDRRIQLTYRLPASIQASNYSLIVQKQPGVDAFPVRVQLDGAGPSDVSFGLWTHHAVRTTAAGLSAVRWTAAEPQSPAAACAIHAEPPHMLARPAAVTLPRLDVEGAIEPLGVQVDGVLEAPSTGELVGWYEVSARPGQVGNMVVSGHFDLHKRPAVFWRLRELQPGDEIAVRDEDNQQHTYTVAWVRDVDAVAAPLNEILGPTTERWLTLITCGGPFNPRTGEYESRTIVRATLAEPVR